MKYIVYNNSGQILRTGDAPESLVGLQAGEGEYAMVGEASDAGQYINNGVIVDLPLKISEHHVFDFTSKQWVDPRTLQDLKGAQWTTIKQARSAAEYAGFTWDGYVFDSDALSQNRITGAVTLAQMSAEFSIGWTLKDNTVRTLSQMDMMQTGAALGAHVAAVFAKGVLLREQIEAATDAATLELIVW